MKRNGRACLDAFAWLAWLQDEPGAAAVQHWLDEADAARAECVTSIINLGEAYYASGNKKEAKKVNDKLKKIDPALSARLDNVLAGRAIDAATQQIQQKVPAKIPRIPRLPF